MSGKQKFTAGCGEGYLPPTGQGEREYFLPGKVKQNPDFASVAVNNDFQIEGSTIRNMAAGNKGPVTMEHQHEVFEAGAKNTKVTVKGGNLVQPNFGGKAKYSNKGADLAAGDGAGGSVGDWDYDVGGSILAILKKNVPLDLLYKALMMGKTIKELEKFVADLDPQKCDIKLFFDSMLQSTEEDMDVN